MEENKDILKFKDIVEVIKDNYKNESVEKTKKIIPIYDVKIEFSSLPINLIYNYIRYQKNYLPQLQDIYEAYGRNMKDAHQVFPFSMSEPVSEIDVYEVNEANDPWGESQKKFFYYNEEMEEMYLIASGRSSQLVVTRYKQEKKRKRIGQS
jgi:hypothetical protein